MFFSSSVLQFFGSNARPERDFEIERRNHEESQEEHSDTALRLARNFNTTPKFWLNLQVSCDLALPREAA
jgi:plasmid maintenance system antidote protein VapI